MGGFLKWLTLVYTGRENRRPLRGLAFLTVLKISHQHPNGRWRWRLDWLGLTLDGRYRFLVRFGLVRFGSVWFGLPINFVFGFWLGCCIEMAVLRLFGRFGQMCNVFELHPSDRGRKKTGPARDACTALGDSSCMRSVC